MSESVLIVEDEPAQAHALRQLLELEGHAVSVRNDGASALEAVTPELELVLCDLRLPDMDGLEVFRRVCERLGDKAPPFVILTAYGTVQSAREALKAGVYDYVTKPVDPTELVSLVSNVQERNRLRRENLALSQAVNPPSLEQRLLGASPSFRELLEVARSAAESEATILVQGESGTGKELVAELIHERSPRRAGPFVRVNCGAIPESLLEAELFGHERGAFTDARRARKGRFELAHGGTIFLDEIAEMPPTLQVKLLRVLQEHELERLGGQGRVIPVDFRLVSATNRDLEALVRQGRFREDLYYRINVIHLKVPPLRERLGDVDLLAQRFCARFAAKNDKHFLRVSEAALERLRAHDWPGNVRELENVIERAVVLGDGPELLPSHLADFDRSAAPDGEVDNLIDAAVDAELPLETYERELIVQALERTKRNVTRAARLLGITRRTLQYRMEKHGIERGSVSD
ncbi:MAG: sigma-54-dependent Fis family transcriptional regulator [Planctomycetota bacterium]|nr:MAG: sigma-54-dependent Fis family transcriptional regulator [Planctomycetota bacterium]